jgi:galacturan 1,4-alpha-galacturonidase
MVHNVTMSNASNGARIKTWPGHGTMTGGVGSGGGGKGRVQNITFDGMRLSRVDYAIEITQCYGQNDMAKCKADPSGVSISNIVIQGFSGTTSGKHGSTVGAFTCSSSSNCRNISVRDMHVSAPGGGSGYRCSGVSVSGIRCGG